MSGANQLGNSYGDSSACLVGQTPSELETPEGEGLSPIYIHHRELGVRRIWEKSVDLTLSFLSKQQAGKL